MRKLLRVFVVAGPVMIALLLLGLGAGRGGLRQRRTRGEREHSTHHGRGPFPLR